MASNSACLVPCVRGRMVLIVSASSDERGARVPSGKRVLLGILVGSNKRGLCVFVFSVSGGVIRRTRRTFRSSLVRLLPVATTSPSRTTTHPTGTSHRFSAPSASTSAARMKRSSSSLNSPSRRGGADIFTTRAIENDVALGRHRRERGGKRKTHPVLKSAPSAFLALPPLPRGGSSSRPYLK